MVFERAREQTRQRYGLCVLGYVVMPEHVHLLLSEPQNGSLATRKTNCPIMLSITIAAAPKPSPRMRPTGFLLMASVSTFIEKLEFCG
jgi:putative transposase